MIGRLPPGDPSKRTPYTSGAVFVLAAVATWLAGTAEGWLVCPVVFFGGVWLLAWVDAARR